MEPSGPLAAQRLNEPLSGATMHRKQESLRKQLTEADQAKRTVQIERSAFSEEYTNGYVLGLSQELVAIEQFFDFQPFGIKILALSDITGVRDGKYERFLERVLVDRGFASRTCSWLELHNWKRVLMSLEGRGKLLAFETDRGDGVEVGLISEIANDSLWILPCTAVAQWCAEEIKIDLADVTAVEVDTPYLETLKFYLDLQE